MNKETASPDDIELLKAREEQFLKKESHMHGHGAGHRQSLHKQIDTSNIGNRPVSISTDTRKRHSEHSSNRTYQEEILNYSSVGREHMKNASMDGMQVE